MTHSMMSQDKNAHSYKSKSNAHYGEKLDKVQDTEF